MTTITLKVCENAKEVPLDEWERLINWFCELRIKYVSEANTESVLAEQSRSLRRELDNKNLTIANLNKRLDSLRKSSTKELSDNEDETPIKKTIPKLDIKDPDGCTKQIKDLYIELTLKKKSNARSDLLNLLSIDEDTLDALGGYEEITSSAKLDYTASILTPDVVRKIAGTKPTRKDIVQKKILTDAAIRRLFYVIKTKKQVEYIINYCNSQYNNLPTEHEAEPELEPESSAEHVEPEPQSEQTEQKKKVKKSKKLKKQIIDEPAE